MRTTLTLDKDVAARLEQAVQKSRLPSKTIVNDALRAGLSVIDKPASISARAWSAAWTMCTACSGGWNLLAHDLLISC